ncbi:MAG: PIG-L deacetylase family protein [Rhodothermales bacterium]
MKIPRRPAFDQKLLQQAQLLPSEALARPAIVFAPHPDDETLGCGGTIVEKLAAGASVHVVFMTDGSRSHRHLMDPRELGLLRVDEARAALAALGVDPGQSTFLMYEDRRLGQSEADAVSRVRGLMDQFGPEDVFIPYRHDVTPDHLATWRIVREALRSSKRPVWINEYPIWHWHHWPFISLPLTLERKTLRVWRDSLLNRFGARAFRDFRTAVYIGDALDRKRNALEAHASQAQRLKDRWPILADVADGEFLDCFFQAHEFFFRYRYPQGHLRG